MWAIPYEIRLREITNISRSKINFLNIVLNNKPHFNVSHIMFLKTNT